MWQRNRPEHVLHPCHSYYPRKVNFCAVKSFGGLPFQSLKGLQQVLFTLWFLSGISLLPIRLHKHSFQRCQTSSATPSCIFFLIPDVRKITLLKASVHKGNRRALQKSILFEQKETSPATPGGISGTFEGRSFLLSQAPDPKCPPPFPIGCGARRAQPSRSAYPIFPL